LVDEFAMDFREASDFADSTFIHKWLLLCVLDSKPLI
jgi:hypothetical protein